MKYCSQCSQDKPKSDFYVRVNLKSGLSCWCKSCSRRKSLEAANRWNVKNPSAARDYMQRIRSDPLFVEREREKGRAAYRSDPERFREKTASWRATNPETSKKIRSDWWVKNPGSRNAARMKRHAAKLQATPIWANSQYVKLWYAFAKSESKRFGQLVEVDHIVPLQSDSVCGLHNEHNMQLLFSNANKAKGNRAWPDMP
jgi:hypothetical protein